MPGPPISRDAHLCVVCGSEDAEADYDGIVLCAPHKLARHEVGLFPLIEEHGV